MESFSDLQSHCCGGECAVVEDDVCCQILFWKIISCTLKNVFVKLSQVTSKLNQ